MCKGPGAKWRPKRRPERRSESPLRGKVVINFFNFMITILDFIVVAQKYERIPSNSKKCIKSWIKI